MDEIHGPKGTIEWEPEDNPPEDAREEHESLALDFWNNVGAKRSHEALDEGSAYTSTNNRPSAGFEDHSQDEQVKYPESAISIDQELV